MKGFSLSKKVDIGLGFNYRFSKSENETDDFEQKNTSWSIAPFLRYSIVEFKKFEVLARGAVDAGGGKVADGKFTSIGVNIAPVLAYNISERITLLANLNWFGLGYNCYKEKDNKKKVTDFGFSGNLNNAMNTSDFQIGFQINI